MSVSSPFAGLDSPFDTGGTVPLSAGSATGGETPFGFAIPQGSPSAISAAANALRLVAHHLGDQNANLDSAAQVAGETNGWQGAGATAFSSYVEHLTSTTGSNADTLDEAASALQRLSQLLEDAQTACQKALSDCQTAQAAVQTAQQQAAAATSSADALSKLAASASGASAHSLTTTSNRLAQDAQTDRNAGNRANDDLTAAMNAGKTAASQYAADAQIVARRIADAAERLKAPQHVSGGAPIPVTVNPADVRLAAEIARGAGGVNALREALGDPPELRRLAKGQKLSPAVTLALLQDLKKEEEEAAELEKALEAAAQREHHSGILHDLGQAGEGALSTLKSAGDTLIHPWRPFESALKNMPWYRQLFDHQNPISANAESENEDNEEAAALLDLKDLEDGNIPRWLGTELTNAALMGGGDEAADTGALSNLGARLSELKSKLPDLSDPEVQGTVAKFASSVVAQKYSPVDVPDGLHELVGSSVEDHGAALLQTVQEGISAATGANQTLDGLAGKVPVEAPKLVPATPYLNRRPQVPNVNPVIYRR